MNERKLSMMKERLQKKLYKTKSEDAKLVEIAEEIKTLQHAKKLILEEYKNTTKTSQPSSFRRSTFEAILNSLSSANQCEQERVVHFSSILQKLTNNRDSKLEKSKNCRKTLEKQKKELESRLDTIQRNSIINQRLESKQKSIYKDIAIIKERILLNRKVERIRNNDLHKIKESRISGEFKKNNSLSYLQYQRKALDRTVVVSRNNLIVKNNDFNRQSDLKNYLFAEAARDKLSCLKLQKEKEELGETIKSLHKETLVYSRRRKPDAETKEALLLPIIEQIDLLYKENSSALNAVDVEEVEDSCVLVNRIIVFFRTINVSIERNHKLLEILNLGRKKKWKTLSDAQQHCTSLGLSTPKDKRFFFKPQKIQMDYFYKLGKENCRFLYEAKNFVSFFGKRLETLVATFNKNCKELDIEIRLDMMKPFFSTQRLFFHRSNNDTPDIKIIQKTDSIELLTLSEEETNLFNSMPVLVSWFVEIFPSFGKREEEESFSVFFLSHFQRILSKFEILKNCLTQLKTEIHRNTTHDNKYKSTKSKKNSFVSGSPLKMRINKLRKDKLEKEFETSEKKDTQNRRKSNKKNTLDFYEKLKLSHKRRVTSQKK